MNHYGKKLNPNRRLKTPKAIKGERREVSITHNPSSIAANQKLFVKFPQLGSDDAIVPGTAKLAFKVDLEGGSDDNRVVYNNLARNLVKEINVRLQGHAIVSYRDADVFHNFKDNWLNPSVTRNKAYVGLERENVSKLRLGAADASEGANGGKDKAIADAFGNRYCIPLDVELLTAHHPFYPSSFRQPLTYELTFNDHDKVVKSTDTSAQYSISDLTLEYEVVTNRDLAQTLRNKHKGPVYYMFDRVHNCETRSVDKSDTLWNVAINQPIKSLKGVLILFRDPTVKNPQRFYNPHITKTSVTVEGKPNQLYSQGMFEYQHWPETCKFFGDSDTESARAIAKDLNLTGIEMGDYYKDKYGLWLDFRSTDDNSAHGSGRRIGDGGGIQIQMTREAESQAPLTMYVFLIMDAQLTVEDGNFKSLMY